jgi:hypothetical protein
MSAEEFWKDDPQLFVSYRTSFINKKKRQIEEEDYKSWLRGLYIHNGGSILLLSLKQFITNLLAGMFKGNKDTKELPTYPDKPYSEMDKVKKKQEKNKENKKQDKYKEFENSLVYFGTLKQQYIEKMKQKGEQIDEQ